ncbi:hypothetical protein J3459_016406 [Metarhizium acridum]|nr:hypothetical protein J3459_016406 [Metarhizium acridum]
MMAGPCCHRGWSRPGEGGGGMPGTDSFGRLRNDRHFVSRPWVETVEIGDRELMRLLIHSDGSCALLHSSSLGEKSTSYTRVPGIQPKPGLYRTELHLWSQVMGQSSWSGHGRVQHQLLLKSKILSSSHRGAGSEKSSLMPTHFCVWLFGYNPSQLRSG